MRLLFALSLSLLAFGCSKEGKPCPADGSCGDELRCEPITKTCQSVCGKPADCKKGLTCDEKEGVCFSERVRREKKESYLVTLAKIDMTRLKISKLKEGANMYNLYFNMYPNSIKDLLYPRGRKPILETTPRDDWGNDLIYKRSSGDTPFVVYSAGPDGIEGTDDDVY